MSEIDLSPVDYYTWLYPQLTLKVEEGMSTSEIYTDIVRKGNLPKECRFPLSVSAETERIEVDAGIATAEVLYLPERNIFEHFVRVLAYRCEPREIPKSTGAILINGVINWRKIKDGREDYKDAVLLITKGDYSAVPCEAAGYEMEKWHELSKTIRIYHELTHFISRKLHPDDKQAVRDEIVADCIGIINALGFYDDDLARLVLGIENSQYRDGGRLQNYVEENELASAIIEANQLIKELKSLYDSGDYDMPFGFLHFVLKKYYS